MFSSLPSLLSSLPSSLLSSLLSSLPSSLPFKLSLLALVVSLKTVLHCFSLYATMSINAENGRRVPSWTTDGAADESTALLSDVAATHPSKRVRALDQYRGFVILWSLTIPMLAYLSGSPHVFGHNTTYFSLADATMPMFYVAIGLAMQLTLLKLQRGAGWRAVYKKQAMRSGALYLVAVVYVGFNGFSSWYGPEGMQEQWWRIFLMPLYLKIETLSIIAVAQLIILPVIARPWPWRFAYFVYLWLLAGLYFIGEYYFWFERVWSYSDGGILGTLSWATVMLVGTLLYDVSGMDARLYGKGSSRNDEQLWEGVGDEQATERRRRLRTYASLFVVGVGLMGLGMGMSALPENWSPVCFDHANSQVVIACRNASVVGIPFVVPDPDYMSIFTMSQRSASFSIQAFGAGWATTIFLGWFILTEETRFDWAYLNILSQNALLMYMLRDKTFDTTRDIFPRDSPYWMTPFVLIVSWFLNWMVATYLARNKLILRL